VPLKQAPLNTWPARGTNAAPKHLLDQENIEILGENQFFFNFSSENIIFLGFSLIFHQFLFRIKKLFKTVLFCGL
jgi:hypothetical protein